MSPLVSPASDLMSHVDLWWYGCDAEPTLDVLGIWMMGQAVQELYFRSWDSKEKHTKHTHKNMVFHGLIFLGNYVSSIFQSFWFT